MPTTLVSWNLKGSGKPDTRAVATYLRSEGADVVVLQEVQWHQARRIARALGARSRHWGFKHWPARHWPEGMAIIGVSSATPGRTRPLTHPWRLWSWRRRIFQVADVQAAPPWTLVNVHLTPHGEIGMRAVEAAKVLDVVAKRPEPVVVAGDLNERPGGAIHRQFAAAGLRDGWAVRVPHPVAPPPTGGSAPAPSRSGPDAWPTNWRGWRRGTTTLPTQQLDYVYATEGVRFVDVHTPGRADLPRFAAISDHLPVTAVVEFG